MPPDPKIPPPICPHADCGKELTGTGVYYWRHEGAMVGCIYCPSCRKPLGFELYPLAPAAPADPSRIARPH